MRAIEINSKTDKKGNLKIDYQLEKSEKKVRVIILLDDNDDSEKNDEKLWTDSISNNPAFEYLFNESEDVYSINDGEPFND